MKNNAKTEYYIPGLNFWILLFVTEYFISNSSNPGSLFIPHLN